MSPMGTFNAEQWAALSGALRLKPASACDPSHTLLARELLDDTLCAQRLDALTPVIRSPSRAVTASLLGKRLSFLTTGACLYALSAFDKGLRLSLDNAMLELLHEGGVWTSAMPLRDLHTHDCPPGARDAWRAEVVGELFGGLLQPLWQTFARVSGVSVRILWDNTAVRVYSLYERRLAKVDDERIRARSAADFHWLLEEADPALFGLNYNPLKHFRRPLTLVDDGQRSVRFRRTCCFYYQASEPVEYCSTCPLLRPRKAR
ncbi:IucA/IucC family C-terminal-domain containing protein [Pseudomonas sp. nanlin1]|uniref:IucA/IucC family C-terminal-domain containing protein n=1 Tax=Pseudomonas sp. nanlin1 TaxID=3040605 RepID=UPI00388E7B28